MKTGFWRECWRNREIGFHQDDTHPALSKYWPGLGATGSVLVPLCGKSLDLLWLAGEGLQVVGVELVESAVEEFFDDNGIASVRGESEGLPWIQSRDGAIRIYACDYFDFAARQPGGGFDALYDRGALVALPPAMRGPYMAATRGLLQADARGLVISFEYDQQRMPGPPFSVAAPELQGYWEQSRDQAWRLAERVNALALLPKAAESGLTELDECWWVF